MKPSVILTGVTFLALSSGLMAGPLRLTSGLTGINVYETTTTTSTYSFSAGTGGIGSPNTFTSGAGETYTVFFSDALGVADLDGEFLSIGCFYPGSGGGCNINGIELVTTGGIISANTLASFRPGLSTPGYVAGSELLAVDGSLATVTQLGNDNDIPMRLTVGIGAPSNTGVPEPSTYGLIATALTAGVLARRKRK